MQQHLMRESFRLENKDMIFFEYEIKSKLCPLYKVYDKVKIAVCVMFLYDRNNFV